MKLISILASLFLVVHAYAQNFEGKIINQDQEALTGALIYNSSQNQHTHSDLKGQFLLTDNTAGDSILISYLGHTNALVVFDPKVSSSDIVLNETALALNEVVISPDLDALKVFSDIDVQLQPVNSSQEVLRQVPGLFIGQHAGGGKAEQIFLRGFDIDHGTDIRLTVDGLPVNMVSHAHGQGYADLHFLIPETIKQVNFDKGSYHADQGNFATAGHVGFQTRDRLDSNVLKAEIGQFNTQRLMTMLSLKGTDRQSAYVATEYLRSDGPFESSQDFSRVNLLAKYRTKIQENQYLSLMGSYFQSSWDASGQIPQRSVDDGSITRFGAIDDTEGGNTSRVNLRLSHLIEITSHSQIENQVFYSYYDFLLFSNFTFFLNNPERGDQIRQEERRNLFGLNSKYRSFHDFIGGQLDFRAGLQLRSDISQDNRLARSANRSEILTTIQFGDIHEDNLGAYLDAHYNFGKWTINTGLRWDQFRYSYEDFLQTNYSKQSTYASRWSPKLNLLYNQSLNLQYYFKSGIGFHSNDTRVILAQQADDILPAAYSLDVGMIAKPSKNLLINVAFWNLYLEQEFVYVGDEGIVEPSGETIRRGIDLSSRYQFSDWLFFDLDATYTVARSIEEPEGADRIPLAPLSTVTSGITIDHSSGFTGGLHARYLGDRPANEDNSIVAIGYTVFDANLGYQIGNLNFGIQIQNLFDVDWNETQFATESRLLNETESVEEIHFTAGTPFFARCVISHSF